jgi:phosphatidylserine synthase
LPQLVVLGAKATCSFGVAPATLAVLPAGQLMQGGGALLATVMDHVPMTNLATFGMCSTQSNPAVAAATSAASGTPTPAPCIPATSSPWSPGSATVTVGGKAALTSDSTCNCAYGGVISITDPGQTTVTTG